MNLVSFKSIFGLVTGLIAVTVLAACGTIHTGQAAVVDGKQISMSTADQRAAAYCAVSIASARQQGVQVLSNSEIRRQAVSDLITGTVAAKVADNQGVTPDPTLYVISDEQLVHIRKVFAKSQPEQVIDAITMAQKTYALTVALGERATGEKLTEANAQKLQGAGENVINEAMKTADITVDDRFGLNDMTAQISETGSQSVEEDNLAKMPAEKLPASQHCA